MKRPNFKTLLATLLLGVATLGLAGCTIPTANTSSTAGERPVSSISDTQLENNINENIQNVVPSKLFSHNAYAVVWQGKTLLLGQVQSEELQNRILDTVHRVYGVNQVINSMEIKSDYNPQFLDRANDTRITAELRAKILSTRGLTSAQYTIITENGVIYILSTAPAEQTQIAVAIAQKVYGVVSVKVLTP